jgi:hypothetical protein
MQQWPEMEMCHNNRPGEEAVRYRLKDGHDEIVPVVRKSGYADLRLPGGWFAEHRVICQECRLMPDGYDVVNHRNHDRAINFWTNLEWLTLRLNSQDKGYVKGEVKEGFDIEDMRIPVQEIVTCPDRLEKNTFRFARRTYWFDKNESRVYELRKLNESSEGSGFFEARPTLSGAKGLAFTICKDESGKHRRLYHFRLEKHAGEEWKRDW